MVKSYHELTIQHFFTLQGLQQEYKAPGKKCKEESSMILFCCEAQWEGGARGGFCCLCLRGTPRKFRKKHANGANEAPGGSSMPKILMKI